MTAVVLNDEGADQKSGRGQRKQQRRPVRVFDRGEHDADDKYQRHERRDQLLDRKARHRIRDTFGNELQAGGRAVFAFPASAAARSGANSGIAHWNFGTALRLQRLLKAHVQSFGPPRVKSTAGHTLRRVAYSTCFAKRR